MSRLVLGAVGMPAWIGFSCIGGHHGNPTIVGDLSMEVKGFNMVMARCTLTIKKVLVHIPTDSLQSLLQC